MPRGRPATAWNPAVARGRGDAAHVGPARGPAPGFEHRSVGRACPARASPGTAAAAVGAGPGRRRPCAGFPQSAPVRARSRPRGGTGTGPFHSARKCPERAEGLARRPLVQRPGRTGAAPGGTGGDGPGRRACRPAAPQRNCGATGTWPSPCTGRPRGAPRNGSRTVRRRTGVVRRTLRLAAPRHPVGRRTLRVESGFTVALAVPLVVAVPSLVAPWQRTGTGRS